MNIVELTGRMTAEPELRYTPDKTPVVNFTLAVRRPSRKDVTDFIRCTAWQKTAEFIGQHCHKGTALEVTGNLQENDYTNKHGENVVSYSVRVDRVDFCIGNRQQQEPSADIKFEPVDSDSDLPF